MKEMTSHERFKRMYEHKEADRVPMLGGPWGTTLERWRREGMPKDVDFADYFGLDQMASVWGDNGPRLESKVIEETDEYVIYKDGWGTTAKNWKHASSTPHWLDRTIVDRPSWEMAKLSCMNPSGRMTSGMSLYPLEFTIWPVESILKEPSRV